NCEIAFAPDGRFLAVATPDCVRLYDWSQGRVGATVDGYQGRPSALAFSPNGRLLVGAGNWDTAALVWDVSHVTGKPPAAGAPRGRADLDRLWRDLAADATAAYRAVWGLASAPDQAVTLLRAQLRPVPRVGPERVERLVQELDDQRFAVRSKAEQEL